MNLGRASVLFAWTWIGATVGCNLEGSVLHSSDLEAHELSDSQPLSKHMPACSWSPRHARILAYRYAELVDSDKLAEYKASLTFFVENGLYRIDAPTPDVEYLNSLLSKAKSSTETEYADKLAIALVQEYRQSVPSLVTIHTRFRNQSVNWNLVPNFDLFFEQLSLEDQWCVMRTIQLSSDSWYKISSRFSQRARNGKNLVDGISLQDHLVGIGERLAATLPDSALRVPDSLIARNLFDSVGGTHITSHYWLGLWRRYWSTFAPDHYTSDDFLEWHLTDMPSLVKHPRFSSSYTDPRIENPPLLNQFFEIFQTLDPEKEEKLKTEIEAWSSSEWNQVSLLLSHNRSFTGKHLVSEGWKSAAIKNLLSHSVNFTDSITTYIASLPEKPEERRALSSSLEERIDLLMTWNQYLPRLIPKSDP